MAKQTVSKFTPAVVARMNELAPLNQALAEQIATEFGGKDAGFSARSIAAKATREGIPYVRKAKVAKNGSPIEKKESIVAEIANLVGESMEGLEKAPKGVLQVLRDHLVAVENDEGE